MDVLSAYQYTKKSRIDGGQGQNSLGVYRAFDPQLGCDVAVKEILKSGVPADYFREAQTMFRSDHPNVVAIRVATQTKTEVCLVMDLYPNGSLATAISSGPLPLERLVHVGQEILAGVGAIHAAKSVHFDIKPSNILFSRQHVAMVADFGQARDSGPSGITLMPNKMYAAATPPEAIVNSRRGSSLSDIYQVGVTLYRAVNGEPEFERQWSSSAANLEADIVAGRFPRRDVFLPHVPDRLRRILRKAMHVNPTKRYQNAVEFSNALTRVRPKYDWQATQLATGGITWSAPRPQNRKIEITLEPDGQTWKIEMHTVNGGTQRRWKTALWQRGSSRAGALKYLTDFFEALV